MQSMDEQKQPTVLRQMGTGGHAAERGRRYVPAGSTMPRLPVPLARRDLYSAFRGLKINFRGRLRAREGAAAGFHSDARVTLRLGAGALMPSGRCRLPSAPWAIPHLPRPRLRVAAPRPSPPPPPSSVLQPAGIGCACTGAARLWSGGEAPRHAFFGLW